MASEHWIRFAGNSDVAIDDNFSELLVSTPLSELLKLVMEVEYQSGAKEAPGRSTGIGVHAHDKKCFFFKTQGKMWVVRIITNAVIW